MYKLVNIMNPRLPLAVSADLTTLFEKLDEYPYKTPVIIDEQKQIVAGHWSA